MWPFRAPTHAPRPVASETDRRLAERAIGVTTTLRTLVRERMQEATAFAEREVLAAGQAVDRMVETASQQIEELRAAVGGHRAADEAAGQRDLTQRFVAEVHRGLERQRKFAQDGRANADRIADAASRIQALSRQAKILALNARIEACRAGDRGTGFTIIAEEMRRLSAEVAAANENIHELSLALRASAPKIEAVVEELGGATDRFSTELADQVTTMVEERQQAVDLADRIVGNSDRALQAIVDGCNETLSHLQFQDPLVQGLQRLDGHLLDAQLQTCDLFGLDPSRFQFEPAQHVELGGDKRIDQADAGNVLFL